MSAAFIMTVGLSRLTATWSAVILILVVSFSDGVGAERAQATESESSRIHGNQIKWKEADRQRSLRTGEPELGQLLQLAELKLDPGKLGRIATNAINRWPAAQEADPAWEWTRVLIFLAQTALIVQGYDPGKPDGVMGPKTMLALLAWSTASGPPWAGDTKKAYVWGMDDNVAHLLREALTTMGLEPGPHDQFLGQESVSDLDRWNETFRIGGKLLNDNEERARDYVMKEFGHTQLSDAGETRRESGRTEPIADPIGWGEDGGHCLEYQFKKRDEAYVYKNVCDYELKIAVCSINGPYGNCGPKGASSKHPYCKSLKINADGHPLNGIVIKHCAYYRYVQGVDPGGEFSLSAFFKEHYAPCLGTYRMDVAYSDPVPIVAEDGSYRCLSESLLLTAEEIN